MKLSRCVVTLVLVSISGLIPVSQARGAQNGQLELLGSFETLLSLGFIPDGVSYSPQGGRLMIAASSDSGVGARGVFEVTQDGELVESFSIPQPATGLLGFSIKRASSGPHVNHFFMAEFTGQPTIRVFEFDPSFALVNSFPVTGTGSPGDGIAFNHVTQNLVVVDGGSNALIEVTTSGDFVRMISTPNAHVVGLTFHQPTGTYFGVDSGGILKELSTDGELLRSFDLTLFGVKNSVGIASGQGKLFIADEGDPPNSGGAIFIFKLR